MLVAEPRHHPRIRAHVRRRNVNKRAYRLFLRKRPGKAPYNARFKPVGFRPYCLRRFFVPFERQLRFFFLPLIKQFIYIFIYNYVALSSPVRYANSGILDAHQRSKTRRYFLGFFQSLTFHYKPSKTALAGAERVILKNPKGPHFNDAAVFQ